MNKVTKISARPIYKKCYRILLRGIKEDLKNGEIYQVPGLENLM